MTPYGGGGTYESFSTDEKNWKGRRESKIYPLMKKGKEGGKTKYTHFWYLENVKLSDTVFKPRCFQK